MWLCNLTTVCTLLLVLLLPPSVFCCSLVFEVWVGLGVMHLLFLFLCFLTSAGHKVVCPQSGLCLHEIPLASSAHLFTLIFIVKL